MMDDPLEEQHQQRAMVQHVDGDDDQDYKMTRLQIAQVCEKLAGRNQLAALAFLERHEHALKAALLFAAPDAGTARRAFEVGQRAFLEPPLK